MSTSTLPSAPMRRRRTPWAVAAVGAMVASTVSLVGPAAHADDPVGPTLQWKISDYVANTGPGGQLSAHTTAEGASEGAGGVFTFPDGVGSYNPSNGTTAITYGGSVTVGKHYSDTQTYAVTIAHPRVVIDADGEGTLSADVSSAAVQGTASSTDVARVTVATFDGSDATEALEGATGRQSFTAAPDWEGVLPADSEAATDLGIGAGKPVEGASFAPSFLQQVVPGVRAFFYQSSAGQDTKAPAAFTAEAGPIAVSYDVTAADAATGLTLSVTGSGFTRDTMSGDAGVYVGIAESGGMPDVSNPANIALFAKAAYVPSIAAGGFTTTMAVPRDKLDSAKSYSIYTWQAHTHSNATQDTETPLSIDFGAFNPTPQVTAEVTGASAAGGVAVQVDGADFTEKTYPTDAGVYIGIAPAGGLPDVSAWDTSSFAAVDYVPSLPDGTFSRTLTAPVDDLDFTKSYAVYTWQAHTHSNTSQDTETPVAIDFDSLKTAPEVTVSGPAKTKFGTSAKFTVAVLRGTGTVTLKTAGRTVVKSLAAGRATVALPRDVAAGKRTVSVKYTGDPRYRDATKSVPLTIAKASAKVVAKVVRKAKVKKVGKVRVKITSPAGTPAGKVKLKLSKGRRHRTVKGKVLKNGVVVVKLPKLGKGTWKAKVSYLGSTNFATATKTIKVKVKK